jgi:hypothetical protein
LTTFRSRLSGDKGPDPNDFVNDLEPPAFQCVPELAQIKNKLLVRFTGISIHFKCAFKK